MHICGVRAYHCAGRRRKEKEQRVDQPRTRARAIKSVKEKTRRRHATRVVQGEFVVSDGHWGVVLLLSRAETRIVRVRLSE